MPKLLRYALIWSHEHQHYTLTRDGQPEQGFLPADPSALTSFLDEQTAFAFLGQAGRLSVLKEARRGGIGYWYAYRTQHRHTRKGYLGRSFQVTLARLEEVAELLASASALAARAQAPSVLLSSKLSPPQLPRALVERERLLATLDTTLSTRLVLVSAPAGFGKTTLLAAWASRRKSQVAWLSLDDLDNSPPRFWVALLVCFLQDRDAERRRLMHYRLRIQGHLDRTFQDRFGGLRIEQQEAGTTMLSGTLPDQTAFSGVLLQLIRLGLVLLSLETGQTEGA